MSMLLAAPMLGVSAGGGAELPEGFIAHYDMSISGTTLIDLAGNFNRTITGATHGSDANGEFLSFDGVDDGVYGTLDAAQKTQEFSYSILFSVAAYPVSGNKAIVSLEPTGTYLNARGAALSINASGNLVARFGNTATSSFISITSTATVPLDTVTSATVTFNAGTGTLFIGTTNEGTDASIGTIQWTDSGSGPSPGQFYLGAERDNTAGVLPNVAFAAVKQYDYIEYPFELNSSQIAVLAGRV